MAHAYTPGLRVSERTHIVKIRRLPLKGEVLVKKGDLVQAETVVARTDLPGNVQTIKAAGILGVHQEDLLEFMLKKERAQVEKDEIIAVSKSLFGLFKSHCKSPCRGTIENISTVTGQVIIREPPIPIEVEAYVAGKVTKVIEGEGVVVEANGAFIQGIFGVGGETQGPLEVVGEDPSAELTAEMIRDTHQGKVIVGGSSVGLAAIQRALQVGVKALVVGGIDDAVLRQLLGYDLGVAITGNETLGITVVMTEGFGMMAMAGRTFNLLRKCQGRKVSVNGATQIRAGVMRPEIVIPVTDSADDAAEGAVVPAESIGIVIGSPVRVIRMPHFGALGEVTDLPSELQALESEAKVRVLKVRFADGSEDVFPRANVEMIEN